MSERNNFSLILPSVKLYSLQILLNSFCIYFTPTACKGNPNKHVFHMPTSSLTKDSWDMCYLASDLQDLNTYTPHKNVWGGLFLAGNHNSHKNWVPFILPNNLCLILMGMKQNFWPFLLWRGLLSDSLTTIWVEPHPCPSHQFIL